MPERRIRLLFVIGQFVQGGSERYLFEVCRAIDREKFDIEILTYTRVSPDQHYFRLLTEQGITIHRLLPRGHKALQRLVPAVFSTPRGQKTQDWLYTLRVQFSLRRFFAQFDVINLIQIELYDALQHAFRDDQPILTHLMSHRIQYMHDPYVNCLPRDRHAFVIIDPWQKQELATGLCASVDTHYMPLVLNFDHREPLPTVLAAKRSVKIGIFSRISSERPMEFFFHALQLLADIDLILHIYGRGDPQGLIPLLEQLGIRDRVIFEGHQPDLEATLRRDNLTAVWMISIGAFVGYASIEVASFGVPIVFWSLRDVEYSEVLAETNGAMHAFTAVEEFVAFNRTIFHAPERLRQIAKRLRDFVLEHNDIRKHITTLEQYLEEQVIEIPSSQEASREALIGIGGDAVSELALDEEIAAGQRFAFGENWRRFLSVLNDERIAEAERSLEGMLKLDTLVGKSFLDIGSGSGLFSLAAMRLGAARVHSFDYDPASVACTQELRRRYYPDAANWTIEQGSALDNAYLARLGQWDIAYSWGVLHHTGAMWQALANVAPLACDGGSLYISIYNDQGLPSRVWLRIKRAYNRSGRFKPLIIGGFTVYQVLRSFTGDLLKRQDPRKRYREYSKLRGMSYRHNLIDWLGGYPFEVATPAAIINYFADRGYVLLRLQTVGTGYGCNEFLFLKQDSEPTTAPGQQ